ncbi:Glutamate carboxypeptidase 2 [Stylophora pistillata]|uniref:Glutamate carboxypeptidase 2 n=1 Tax=Stylophora pistillata TaxID=50429 RepID=A0A2B4SNS7_STYPI|nr:Glutamate carboxypeptidase 2 [Stylophora pistillata]
MVSEDYAKQGVDMVYPDYNWLPDSAIHTARKHQINSNKRRSADTGLPFNETLTRDVVPSNSSFQGGLKFPYGVEMAEDDQRMETKAYYSVVKLGSRGIAEYSRLLSARAVAYLNQDMAVDGNYSFRAKSAPLMDWVVVKRAMKVPSPLGNETAFEEWIRKIPNTLGLNYLPRLQQPRAGSDYVNFIQRLGIPIVDIRYTYNSKTTRNTLYHTVHDNFWWMSTLIDPEFKYHQVTTRVWTEISMVLADSVIPPFKVTYYGVNMKILQRRHYFLDEAVENFQSAPREFDAFVKDQKEAEDKNVAVVRKINTRFLDVERAFINLEGILQANPLQIV